MQLIYNTTNLVDIVFITTIVTFSNILTKLDPNLINLINNLTYKKKLYNIKLNILTFIIVYSLTLFIIVTNNINFVRQGVNIFFVWLLLCKNTTIFLVTKLFQNFLSNCLKIFNFIKIQLTVFRNLNLFLCGNILGLFTYSDKLSEEDKLKLILNLKKISENIIKEFNDYKKTVYLERQNIDSIDFDIWRFLSKETRKTKEIYDLFESQNRYYEGKYKNFTLEMFEDELNSLNEIYKLLEYQSFIMDYHINGPIAYFNYLDFWWKVLIISSTIILGFGVGYKIYNNFSWNNGSANYDGQFNFFNKYADIYQDPNTVTLYYNPINNNNISNINYNTLLFVNNKNTNNLINIQNYECSYYFNNLLIMFVISLFFILISYYFYKFLKKLRIKYKNYKLKLPFT